MNVLSRDERGSDDPGTTQIVGLGASAGGLEALEQFLANVPVDSGLAYIVVQDLDPTHKAMLVELLQRATVMPVRGATESLRVEPNVVYVIPPNTELSVVRGLLHIFASGHRHGACDKPGHPCNQNALRSRACRRDPQDQAGCGDYAVIRTKNSGTEPACTMCLVPFTVSHGFNFVTENTLQRLSARHARNPRLNGALADMWRDRHFSGALGIDHSPVCVLSLWQCMQSLLKVVT